MKQKATAKGNALKYLSYLSLLIGLSLLGIVFVYYMIVLSASIGFLAGYNNVAQSIGFSLSSIYCNFFFMLFSLGSIGAILTYTGWILIPKVMKEGI